MAWEQELQSLEAAIMRLNADYDAFLYGSTSRPPVETRRSIEQILRHLGVLEPDSAADRYRFATLQGRYNALCERWDRLQAEKEAGKRPGLYGGFARESRRVATPSGPPSASRSVLNGSLPSSVERRGGVDRDRDLFERYLAARQARGEDVGGYDLVRFKQSLEREREKLKERFGNVDVDFDVAEREGRVKLVARKRSAVPGRASESGGEGKK